MKIQLSLLALLGLFLVKGQQQLPLNDMSAFQPQAGNWQIVGDVVMDRNRDIHDEPDSGKKKKDNSSKAVIYSSGTGILLNYNNDKQKDNLISKFEHGDIWLSLEVMIPKGSNSGIYLQGRYEVQLLDSWGVRNPSYGDIGGIYRNWETEPTKMLKGVPPGTNASKAPGLWQKFDILFRAPTFDEEGNKLTNAIFEYVDLNGVRIHSNLEVPLPTGGPICKEEATKGPLMIQGDHGPVAFRNIKYKLYEPSGIDVSDLRYTAYRGEFKTTNEVLGGKETSKGDSKWIDIGVMDAEDHYGVVFEGNIAVPETGNYTFTAGWGGALALKVNDVEVISSQGMSWSGRTEETINLTEDTHSFQLINFKSAGWIRPHLGFYINGENNFAKPFHLFSSYPETDNVSAPIFVDAGSEARLLRAFTYFKGDNNLKLSHTIGIGLPDKIHFIYDLNRGNPVALWRGEFIDATPMWENRGNGSFRPRGAVQWTFVNQSISKLENMEAPFPDGRTESFTPKGYSIDETTGLPRFKSIVQGKSVEDFIYPDNENKYLIRELDFDGSGYDGFYQKIAEGKVRKLNDGSFAIGDQQYYINVLSEQEPFIREVSGVTELIIPLNGNKVKYEIIW